MTSNCHNASGKALIAWFAKLLNSEASVYQRQTACYKIENQFSSPKQKIVDISQKSNIDFTIICEIYQQTNIWAKGALFGLKTKIE